MGKGRGEERESLDLLSSVAVVGQGRPSLGDANYQFFMLLHAEGGRGDGGGLTIVGVQ